KAASTAAPAAASSPRRAAARTATELIQTPQDDPWADAATTVPVATAGSTPEMRQGDETDDHQPENRRKRATARMLPLLLGLLGDRHCLLGFVRRKAHLL